MRLQPHYLPLSGIHLLGLVTCILHFLFELVAVLAERLRALFRVLVDEVELDLDLALRGRHILLPPSVRRCVLLEHSCVGCIDVFFVCLDTCFRGGPWIGGHGVRLNGVNSSAAVPQCCLAGGRLRQNDYGFYEGG